MVFIMAVQHRFYKCASLASLNIPEGIVKIQDTFANSCTELKTLILPDTLSEIGKSAFYGCSSLSSVTVMPQVTVIGNSAFGRNAAGFTIFGYTNSAAQKFADMNNIKFTAIGEIKPTPKPEPTLPPAPTCAPDDPIQVVTKEAEDITESSAILNGSLSDSTAWSAEYVYMLKSGGEVMYASCYLPEWKARVDGLLTGQTYIYYLYDHNNNKRGDIMEFTTLGATPSPSPSPTPTTEPTPQPTSPPMPTDTPPGPTSESRCAVKTKAATEVEQNTAVLNGELEIYNPIIKDELRYCFWKDGSEETKMVYGSKTTVPPYQGRIYGLEAGTKYYYYAYNSDVKGETLSFTALSSVTPPDGYTYPYRIVSDSVSGDVRSILIERYKTMSDAMVICASYDERGALLGVEVKTLSGGGEGILDVEFTATQNQRVFVWENADTMEPMAEAYEIKPEKGR